MRSRCCFCLLRTSILRRPGNQIKSQTKPKKLLGETKNGELKPGDRIKNARESGVPVSRPDDSWTREPDTPGARRCPPALVSLAASSPRPPLLPIAFFPSGRADTWTAG